MYFIYQVKLDNIPKGSTSRFAKIVALTGMRPEYLSELKFEDIDFQNGTVKYKDFKSNIPLGFGLIFCSNF